MKDYNESQTRTFKTFLVFTMSCLSILLILMTVTSQTYRISEIAYNFSEDFELKSLEQLYGKSIWMVDENSFEGVYTDNPDIKKLSITKDLPSRLLITVEVYEKMAHKQFERIIKEANIKWNLIDTLIIHRYGKLQVNDKIVLVASFSTHRKDSLESCDFIMDYLKKDAPFWKNEFYDKKNKWLTNTN